MTLTPRFIAVLEGTRLSPTGSTVGSGKTLETVQSHAAAPFTAMNRGVNEPASRGALSSCNCGITAVASYQLSVVSYDEGQRISSQRCG
jgi:hypothetical protein